MGPKFEWVQFEVVRLDLKIGTRLLNWELGLDRGLGNVSPPQILFSSLFSC